MTDGRGRSSAPDPAEGRVIELLLALRDDPPRPGTALARRIVRRARVQRAIVGPLQLLSAFAAALADGARTAIESSSRRRRP
jgi:hypothetical protein